jgi:hypothetical protein
VKIKLTHAQANSFMAAYYCLSELHIDTTGEFSGYDNSVPGTGRRLVALESKGLLIRVGMWSGRAGRHWEATRRGWKLYQSMKRRDDYLRAQRKTNKIPPMLGGTYIVD